MFFELSFNLFLRKDFIGDISILDIVIRIKFRIKIKNIINFILVLKILFTDISLDRKNIINENIIIDKKMKKFVY